MVDERDLKRPMPDVIALLPLRGTVLFPHAVMPLAAGRASSLRLIEDIAHGSRLFGAVTQRDPADDAPAADGLHPVGTFGVVHKVLKQADGTVRVVVQGLGRFRIEELVQTEPYLRARVTEIVEPEEASDVELEALARSVTSLFEKVVALSPNLPDELSSVIAGADTPGVLTDLVAASMPGLSIVLRQELLETIGVRDRLNKLAAALGKEAEVLELGSKIQSEVQSEVSKNQREYLLREQLKAIQKELGDTDERTQEIDELRRKIEAAGMPEEAHREAVRELDRLAKMPPAAAEYTVARTYIDWLVSMPWTVQTTDSVDLDAARAVLDDDHEGLEKIKDRILEYLAVRKVKPDGKDPILCFVGPPGVGKTSLGRSIARALGRKFHRISLGGIRDEAEIRGHRRTYVGALPGQVVQGLRRAGSKNPVFMLDEIDKLGMDFRGDPASALLEVLDPEQNATFRDHYLDVPFDLSRILFVTTANVIDAVPPPLRDRMEVIHLAGYTEEEKLRIAERHLVPKQVREHGLDPARDIIFTPAALRLLARCYTREAGVRNLEREIGRVLRHAAVLIAEYAARKRFDQWLLLWAGVKVVIVFVLSYKVLFLPFDRSYQLFYSGIDPSPEKTHLYVYLLIHGLFLFLATTFLRRELDSRWRNLSFTGKRVLLIFAAVVLLAFAGLVWKEYFAVALMLALAAVALALLALELMYRKPDMPVNMFALCLIGLALAVGIGVDFITLKGDIVRMNTVFKFYLQAWVLFALASGYLMWLLVFRKDAWWRKSAGGKVWLGVLALLVLSAAIYPVAGARSRASDRFGPLPPTGDSMEFMKTAVYHDEKGDIQLFWDYEALRWMQDNIEGSPVIIEGLTPFYRWGGRVTVYTGLPAVFGWDWHERQQRWDYQFMIEERIRDVNDFYTTPDLSRATALIQKYGVEYVYVGRVEQLYYPAAGLAKFAQMAGKQLDIVYQNQQVKVYRVRE